MENVLQHIPVIDAHVHLWDVHRFHYPWLNEVPSIKKNFLTEDYQLASSTFNIQKWVFVQAECMPQQCEEEVAFVTEQVAKDPRIQGIVAYAPVELGKKVLPILDRYKQNSLIKGIRRMYDDNPGLCCSVPFLDALNLLPQYSYSFDISVKPHAIAATLKMIRACPDTLFVLDHLGKPDIKHKAWTAFRKNIDELAAFPNVVAKISGLITEAAWESWTPADLQPYIHHAIDCFGYDRLLFGSDWPVVLLAGSYSAWLDTAAALLTDEGNNALHRVFYKNAERIYRL